MDRFRTIKGGRSEERTCEDKNQSEQVTCRKCGGSHFIKTFLSPMAKKGKITGGTPALVCVHCLAKGEVSREV